MRNVPNGVVGQSFAILVELFPTGDKRNKGSLGDRRSEGLNHTLSSLYVYIFFMSHLFIHEG